VRKNGGTISVASFKGLGTAFTLSFRAAPQKGEGAEGTEA
jgi:signal transduction histidine kinase